jgi:hypothetical protein
VKFNPVSGLFRFAFEILDAQCIVPGLNRFGEGASGYIKLQGYTFAANLTCRSPLDDFGYGVDSAGLLSHEIISPDCVLEKTSELSVRRSTRSGLNETFCLPVTCLYLGHDLVSYVLILGQSEASAGKYTRLGLLRVISPDRMLRLAALRFTASKEIMTIF